MSEFTFLFRGRKYGSSPEDKQRHMEKWHAWFKDLNAKSVIKNAGNPLRNEGSVVQGKKKLVTDGPYAEKDVVGGFIVIEAESLAEATEIAKGCPILEIGGAVEVRPVELRPA